MGESGERDQVRPLAAPQIKLCWWLVLKGSTSKRMLALRRALGTGGQGRAAYAEDSGLGQPIQAGLQEPIYKRSH